MSEPTHCLVPAALTDEQEQAFEDAVNAKTGEQRVETIGCLNAERYRPLREG